MELSIEQIKEKFGKKIEINGEGYGTWEGKNKKVELNFLFYSHHVAIWAYVYGYNQRSVDEDYATENSEDIDYTSTLTEKELIKKGKMIAVKRLRGMIANILSD